MLPLAALPIALNIGAPFANTFPSPGNSLVITPPTLPATLPAVLPAVFTKLPALPATLEAVPVTALIPPLTALIGAVIVLVIPLTALEAPLLRRFPAPLIRLPPLLRRFPVPLTTLGLCNVLNASFPLFSTNFVALLLNIELFV